MGIKVLDYGAGNLGSIVNFLDIVGYNAAITQNAEDIVKADLLILPGVGSARNALQNLEADDKFKALKLRNERRLPIVGICLGAQLFYEHLTEADRGGLGFLPGRVERFKSNPGFNNGWCELAFESLKKAGLSKNLKKYDTYYFNHQYYLPNNSDGLTAISVSEREDIPAIVIKDNLTGIQFHPEKSQKSGITLLKNLLTDYYGL
jgi:glutamine amidotransferase